MPKMADKYIPLMVEFRVCHSWNKMGHQNCAMNIPAKAGQWEGMGMRLPIRCLPRCFGCNLDILQLGVPVENNMLLHKNTLLSSIVA